MDAPDKTGSLTGGNTNRLIVHSSKNRVLLEVPLTAGIVGGGLLVISAPHLTAVAAIVAMATRTRIDVVPLPIPEVAPAAEEATT